LSFDKTGQASNGPPIIAKSDTASIFVRQRLEIERTRNENTSHIWRQFEIIRSG
jgi:hypothetical protein